MDDQNQKSREDSVGSGTRYVNLYRKGAFFSLGFEWYMSRHDAEQDGHERDGYHKTVEIDLD